MSPIWYNIGEFKSVKGIKIMNNQLNGKNGSAEVVIEQSSVDDFLKYLSENEKYLSGSAGVFHTDNHGNW